MKDWQAVFDDERICVIVPTYNNEKTIVDVLQRIQAYTHNIIVVNDGSTPETLAAIRTSWIMHRIAVRATRLSRASGGRWSSATAMPSPSILTGNTSQRIFP